MWNQCACPCLQLLLPSDLYLWLSSLELVNCLSLFLLFMLQQKTQARSALLQVAENDLSVKLFMAEYNQTDRRAESANRGKGVKRLYIQNEEHTTKRTITQHLPIVGSLQLFDCFAQILTYGLLCTFSGNPLQPSSFSYVTKEGFFSIFILATPHSYSH